MSDWYFYYHLVDKLITELADRTGWSDRRILDAYFASSASRKLLDPDARYNEKDIQEIISCDRHDDSPALNRYREVYAYILLTTMIPYCLEYDVDPRELYEAGRGSKLFTGIETDSDVFGHFDPEENYLGLKKCFTDILHGIDFDIDAIDFSGDGDGTGDDDSRS